MINAVAYIRMSSDKQEASPKQQREEIAGLPYRPFPTAGRFPAALKGSNQFGV